MGGIALNLNLPLLVLLVLTYLGFAMGIRLGKTITSLILKRPIVCVFEATRKCNSRCNMCSIWERRSNKEMDFEVFKKTFRKLSKIGICEVLVQGGEPLMHPKIKEMLIFLNKHFGVRLISNGLLLNEEIIGFLKKEKISLIISLDSLDRKKYKAIRGIDSLPLLIKKIELLKEKEFYDVLFHCTVSKVNISEVIKIREYVLSKGFMFSALPYISGVGFAGKKSKSLLIKNKGLINVFDKLKKLEENRDYSYHLIYSEVIRYLRGEAIGKCDALSNSIYLTEEGFITPCIEKSHFADAKKESVKILRQKINSLVQKELVRACYTNTPCYYGCTRLVGCMKKNLFLIASHPLKAMHSIKTGFK